jgi:cytosine deaminase
VTSGTISEIGFDDLEITDWMGYSRAYEEAAAGLSEGGVPVGSSLRRGSEIVAGGRNRRVQDGDPIAHGEMNCLRVAGRQRTYADTTLYTTLAPCMMCTGTILQFKIPRVVVGEARSFEGNLDMLVGAGVEVILLDHQPSVDLMAEFTTRYPEIWAEDIAESSD